MDLIPIPVTNAFTSATSLVIIASQLKSVSGLKYLGTSFSTYLYGFFEHITEVKLGDCVLGLCCCTALLLLRASKYISKHNDFPKFFLYLVTDVINLSVVKA